MKHFNNKEAGIEVIGKFGAKTTKESKAEETDILDEPVKEAAEEKPLIDKPKAIKRGEVSGCEIVNFRKAPSFDSEVIDALSRGMEFDILPGGNKEFTYVDYKGTVGYICSDYVKEV